MRSTALLLLALTLRLNTAAIAAEILDEAQAIREIERLGGKVTRDATLPGRPVTVVCFGAESKFEDMDVPLFKPLTRLATLDLSQTKMSGTHIRGAGLRSLRELEHLTQLNLAHTQISDTGLREIKKLQSLTVLCLEGTQVTDAGLNEIKSLEKLKNLNLRHTGVTGAGLDELRHSLPNVTIFPLVPVAPQKSCANQRRLEKSYGSEAHRAGRHVAPTPCDGRRFQSWQRRWRRGCCTAQAVHQAEKARPQRHRDFTGRPEATIGNEQPDDARPQ